MKTNNKKVIFSMKGMFLISKYFIKKYGVVDGFCRAMKKGLVKRVA